MPSIERAIESYGAALSIAPDYAFLAWGWWWARSKKLVSIKRKYDKHNLFRVNQNVKP